MRHILHYRDHMMKKILQFMALMALAFAATAQPYPSKPVRLVVGFNPGGPTDQVARVVAEELSKKLGQPFVVENRAGGNGAIAAQTVIASPADGYTLLVGTSGALTVNPVMFKSMPYSPQKDLAPVAMLAAYPYALVVPVSLPVNDVKSLVEYVKKNPGKVSFSSAGPGSVNHLAGEWFKDIAKVDIVHVPYKGDAPALTDLIAGRVEMGFNTLTTSIPQVKGGKLKALAVTSPKPTSLAPGLTTMVDLGYRDFVVEPWNGLFGPANLPADVANRLNQAVNEVLAQPRVQAQIAETGQYVLMDSPAGIRKRMETQTERWREIARAAKLQPE